MKLVARIAVGLLLFIVVALGLLYVLRSGGNVVHQTLSASPQSQPTGQPVELRVFIYNVQARPWLDDYEEKLPRISPLLNGFDIVGIEECFRRHDLLWAQADYPNKVYFGELLRPWKPVGSGLTALTRLPMHGAELVHFDHHGEFQNQLASKGILHLKLDAHGYPLDFYLTHMEAGDTPAAHAAQLAQAQQMVDFVTAQSPPDHAIIITGDFNVSPARPGRAWEDFSPRHASNMEDMLARNKAFQTMKEGLQLRDAHDELFDPDPDHIERYLFRPPAGADMTPIALTNDGTPYRREDGSPLSDGAPFVCTFRIAPKAE